MYASAAELITLQITAIPTATEIANSGDRLRTSTLSGGTAIDPTTGEELDGTFAWKSSGTKVTESGYYDVVFKPSDLDAYTLAYCLVFVRIAGDDTEVTLVTMIEEAPTITNTLMAGDDWSEFTFTGGKAVDENGTEVEGVFTLNHTGTIGTAGTRQVEFLFTPDNELYATATVKVTAIVNAIPISFGPDHKGTTIDDPFVLEVAPGADMGTVRDELKNYHLNWPGGASVQIEDQWGTAEHGRIYEYRVSPYNNSNYTGNIAYVKLVFKDVEFAVSSASYAADAEEIYVNFNSNKPNGTFDVYVDGKLIGDDVKLANDRIKVPYAPETSGTHTVKVVYNPTENDYYFMADYETEIQANVRRYITLKNTNSSQEISVNGKAAYPSSAYIKYGDEISIKYGFEVFAAWVITDAAGKPVDLGVDLTSSEITFTMLDHDIVIAVKTTLDEEETPDDGTADDANNGIFGGIWSFFRKIIDWFINIFKQMMSLFAPKA